MIFIDLNNNPPCQDWIDRADILTQQLINTPNITDKHQIIDENQGMWGEIKEFLSNLKNKKCWYSESRNDGAHCHVDHFRPKKESINESGNDLGGYWWLAFDWRNYRYSGPASNVRKRSYFHVNSNKANNYLDSLEDEDIRFLDPTEIDDPPKLGFNIEGMAHPKSTNVTSRDYIQAEYTIRRMNLNLAGLVDNRKDKYRRTQLLVSATERLLQQQQALFSVARRQRINAHLMELYSMSSSNSEYSATVKYCLKSTGHDWALQIVSNAA